ncbi:MAG: hypothetical protein VKJ04_05405 [Vampirovibrionales bacterium]|nr:hypothetical protein [Vampirovibrionales bacterium]
MADWRESPFFDYRCDACGTPFCERVHVMNLALDRIEEEFCLACLSQEYAMAEPEMADYTWDYVQARDCFKSPWENFDAATCPKIEAGQCFCQKSTQ